MNTTDKTTTMGGHRVKDTGMKEGIGGVAVTLWRCLDCQQAATYNSFSTGTDGCPMRPESLDYLSVCPGGDLCEGHPDTSTPEWRMWKESPSMPKEQVPQIHCDAALLGVRAARQWLKYADKIGLKTSVWAETAVADRVGAGGGRIADLNTTAGHYHIVVTRYGKLRAHTDPYRGCPACGDLAEKGDITA